MSNTRRRNHFIPRFLLNRFATRGRGPKSRIWQLSKDAEPREISTRKVAVAGNFYGGQGTGVEDALSVAESRFSEALVTLDAGKPPGELAEALRQFVWTLAVRTQAMRYQFSSVAENAILKMAENFDTPDARQSLVGHLESAFDDEVEKVISELPPNLQAQIRAWLQSPSNRSAWLEWSKAEIGKSDYKSLLVESMDKAVGEGKLKDSIEQAQIRGLERLLGKGVAPEAFCPRNWEILQGAAGSFVLGDICVVGLSQDRSLGSVLRSAGSWGEVYLPISSGQVLVGMWESGPPALSCEQINRASAELSYMYLYASRLTSETKDLSSRIGTGEPFLNEKELDEMIKETLRANDRQ